MKRFMMFFLLTFFFLAYSAHAIIAVSSGNVSKANMRMSIVNGTAFVDFSSAGALTNYIGHKLVITDSGGTRELVGYIKAAGTGETVGTNTHATFDFTSGWSTASSTINSANSYTTAAAGGIFKQSWIIGGLYFLSAQGSGTSVTISDLKDDAGTRVILCDLGSTVYYTTTSVSGWSGNYYLRNGVSGSTTITAISSQQVLAPATTGVTITSTANSTTYNWASETSAFNRNDASGYTYTIYPGAVNTTTSGGGTTGPVLIDCADVAGTLGVDVTGTETLLNYTIVRCPAGAIQATESCTIKNTIGISAGNDITIASGKTVTALNNLFGDSAKAGSGTYSDAGSTTKWSSDPLFVSTTDFHLKALSPAIDAGVDVSLTSDYSGAKVPQRTAPSIGVYEYIRKRVGNRIMPGVVGSAI